MYYCLIFSTWRLLIIILFFLKVFLLFIEEMFDNLSKCRFFYGRIRKSRIPAFCNIIGQTLVILTEKELFKLSSEEQTIKILYKLYFYITYGYFLHQIYKIRYVFRSYEHWKLHQWLETLADRIYYFILTKGFIFSKLNALFPNEFRMMKVATLNFFRETLNGI